MCEVLELIKKCVFYVNPNGVSICSALLLLFQEFVALFLYQGSSSSLDDSLIAIGIACGTGRMNIFVG